MKRITTNKPVGMSENMRNMVFAKDNEVYLRGFGENGEDISLVNYCRPEYEKLHKYELEKNISACDFGEYMDDNDLLSNFYWVCVGFCEVRARLMHYEEKLGEATTEEITEVVARNCVAWDTSKDKTQGLLPEVAVFSNPSLYKKLTGKKYNFSEVCKKYDIKH